MAELSDPIEVGDVNTTIRENFSEFNQLSSLADDQELANINSKHAAQLNALEREESLVDLFPQLKSVAIQGMQLQRRNQEATALVDKQQWEDKERTRITEEVLAKREEEGLDDEAVNLKIAEELKKVDYFASKRFRSLSGYTRKRTIENYLNKQALRYNPAEDIEGFESFEDPIAMERALYNYKIEQTKKLKGLDIIDDKVLENSYFKLTRVIDEDVRINFEDRIENKDSQDAAITEQDQLNTKLKANQNTTPAKAYLEEVRRVAKLKFFGDYTAAHDYVSGNILELIKRGEIKEEFFNKLATEEYTGFDGQTHTFKEQNSNRFNSFLEAFIEHKKTFNNNLSQERTYRQNTLLESVAAAEESGVYQLPNDQGVLETIPPNQYYQRVIDEFKTIPNYSQTKLNWLLDKKTTALGNPEKDIEDRKRLELEKANYRLDNESLKDVSYNLREEYKKHVENQIELRQGLDRPEELKYWQSVANSRISHIKGDTSYQKVGDNLHKMLLEVNKQAQAANALLPKEKQKSITAIANESRNIVKDYFENLIGNAAENGFLDSVYGYKPEIMDADLTSDSIQAKQVSPMHPDFGKNLDWLKRIHKDHGINALIVPMKNGESVFGPREMWINARDGFGEPTWKAAGILKYLSDLYNESEEVILNTILDTIGEDPAKSRHTSMIIESLQDKGEKFLIRQPENRHDAIKRARAYYSIVDPDSTVVGDEYLWDGEDESDATREEIESYIKNQYISKIDTNADGKIDEQDQIQINIPLTILTKKYLDAGVDVVQITKPNTPENERLLLDYFASTVNPQEKRFLLNTHFTRPGINNK